MATICLWQDACNKKLTDSINKSHETTGDLNIPTTLSFDTIKVK